MTLQRVFISIGTTLYKENLPFLYTVTSLIPTEQNQFILDLHSIHNGTRIQLTLNQSKLIDQDGHTWKIVIPDSNYIPK